MKTTRTQRKVLSELASPHTYLIFVVSLGRWSINGGERYVMEGTARELMRLGLVKHKKGADVGTLRITPLGRAALAAQGQAQETIEKGENA